MLFLVFQLKKLSHKVIDPSQAAESGVKLRPFGTVSNTFDSVP